MSKILLNLAHFLLFLLLFGAMFNQIDSKIAVIKNNIDVFFIISDGNIRIFGKIFRQSCENCINNASFDRIFFLFLRLSCFLFSRCGCLMDGCSNLVLLGFLCQLFDSFIRDIVLITKPKVNSLIIANVVFGLERFNFSIGDINNFAIIKFVSDADAPFLQEVNQEDKESNVTNRVDISVSIVEIKVDCVKQKNNSHDKFHCLVHLFFPLFL